MQSRIVSCLPVSREYLRARILACRNYQCNRRRSYASSGSTFSLLARHDRRSIAVSSFHSSIVLSADAASQSEDSHLNVTIDRTQDEENPHPTEIQYAFSPPPPISEESQKKIESLFEKIVWLDMIEVHLLTQLVHEQMGVKWSEVENAGGPMKAGATLGATAEEDAPEERMLRDIKLVGFDAKAKIKVIKEVRAIAGLGLKEAKELVESAPKVIQKELKPEKAEELKVQLEAAGAQVEIV